MADDWLVISSAGLDSFCGESYGRTLAEGLDGTEWWQHGIWHTHWFVIDLGKTYTIKKVRGRSLSGADPANVNIYIDDNNPPSTLCEGGITTWQDRDTWSEITLTSEGTGRYIKVEIVATEHGADADIVFGTQSAPFFTIFDAYGDVAAPPRVPRPTAAVGNPYMF